MDKFVGEPAEVYSFDDFGFYPYLNVYNREVFFRCDTQSILNRIVQNRRRSSMSYYSHANISIHQPFSPEEHEAVVNFLYLTKFFDLHVPLHSLPYQIMSSMHRQNDREGSIYRSSESIIQYLTEIYFRRSTLFNADDEPIVLTSKLRSFPTLRRSSKFDIHRHIENIGMFTKNSKVVRIENILPSVIVIFIVDVSPIVVDLSVAVNSNNPNFDAVFLMCGTSRFAVTNNPEFCSDHRRFCCYYENQKLNFIDLHKRVRFRNSEVSIPSFKCWSYSCFESLTMLCACVDPENPDSMIIAAAVNGESINAWEFHSADQTVSRFCYELKPIQLKWINGRRLAIVTADQDITVVPFPWTDDDELEPVTYTMQGEHRFVECQGDAFVLEEKKSGTHKVSIIPFNEDAFEVDSDFPIDKCAYFRGSFAMNNEKGDIFVWDQKVKHTRSFISESESIKNIVPVDLFRNLQPLFVRIIANNVRFFDTYGKTSVEHSTDSSSIDAFFHPNGYCVTVSDKLVMSLKWFGHNF